MFWADGCTQGPKAENQIREASEANILNQTEKVNKPANESDLRKKDRNSRAVNDSWYSPPSDLKRFRWAEPLPSSDIAEVVADHTSEAEEQLRDIACVEISDDRAAKLVGKQLSKPPGAKSFLVRAVYLNRGTGRFMAYLVGNELMVEHGSLGHSAPPMKRQPLVISLSRLPDKVYVSYSMAQ